MISPAPWKTGPINYADVYDASGERGYRTKSELLAEMDALESRFSGKQAPAWVIAKLDRLIDEIARSN